MARHIVLHATEVIMFFFSTKDMILLTLDPLADHNATGDQEYYVIQHEQFSLTCTVMSKDPDVHVFWHRADGK